VLLYLAAQPDRAVSTAEMSRAYGISRHHLVRVVQTLTRSGFVETIPGRSGGVRLAKPPGSLTIGQVVRECEPGFRMVECFDPATNTCPITPVCELKRFLGEALDAFLTVLDGYTLADAAAANNGGNLKDFFIQIRPAAS
jgi:Rrf2 family nitric oxide-sensitive transcriptional repressor